MKGEGYEMFQPPDEDEKSTNSKESEEEHEQGSQEGNYTVKKIPLTED